MKIELMDTFQYQPCLAQRSIEGSETLTCYILKYRPIHKTFITFMTLLFYLLP